MNSNYTFEVDKVVVTYYQEPDIYSDIDTIERNEITIESESMVLDANFFVIKTERWAFDNIEEMVALLEDFKKRIALVTNNLVKPKDD